MKFIIRVVITSLIPSRIFISVGGRTQAAPPRKEPTMASIMIRVGGRIPYTRRPIHVATIEPITNCPCPPMFQTLAVNGTESPTATIRSGTAPPIVEINPWREPKAILKRETRPPIGERPKREKRSELRKTARNVKKIIRTTLVNAAIQPSQSALECVESGGYG